MLSVVPPLPSLRSAQDGERSAGHLSAPGTLGSAPPSKAPQHKPATPSHPHFARMHLGSHIAHLALARRCTSYFPRACGAKSVASLATI